jgi:hypothetical protein
MRLLIVILLFLHVQKASGQRMLVDKSSHKIFFEDNIPVENIDQQEAENRTWHWINTQFDKKSLTYQDTESGEFKIKAYREFIYPAAKDYKVLMWFEIIFHPASNGFHYRIEDIVYENRIWEKESWVSTKMPAEKILTGVGYYQANGRPKRLSEQYTRETFRIVNNEVDSMKKYLLIPSEGIELANRKN